MSDLTGDEYTALMLAQQGNLMIPIGRWEKPINDLHARGLLVKNDKFNYGSNAAGNAALAEYEKALDAYGTETANRLANARTQAQQSIEQAAIHLSFAAKSASIATGDTPSEAVKKWLGSVEKRALELVEQ